MTSVQSMHRSGARRAGARRPERLGVALITLIALSMVGGCEPRLSPPPRTLAPYEHEQLWGIAAFRNESGVSIVDPSAIADAFMMQTDQVEGVRAIPVNRVIAAMRSMNMEAVGSFADALTLMNVLKLDGLVVGTVSVYDPYRPMRLGLAVDLYVRDSTPYTDLDPRALSRSTGGQVSPGEIGPPLPVAQASGVFDASNHQVIQWVRAYGKGRNDPNGALRTDTYFVSMDSYTEFVCHHLLKDLLVQEQLRLEPMAQQAKR